MKHRLIVVIASALFSGSVHADFMKVDLQFSVDNGTSWSDNVETSGPSVLARFLISAQRTAGMLSIGGLGITQVDLTNGNVGDALTLISLPPTESTWPWYFGVIGGTKIDRFLNPTTADLTLVQLPLNLGGSPDNPWVAAVFSYNLADAGLRTIGFSAQTTYLRTTRVYTTAGGSSVLITQNVSFDGGSIKVAPVPAGIAAFAPAGLLCLRRIRGRTNAA